MSFLPTARGRLGWRLLEGCLQAIDVGQNPLMQFDERRAGPAKAPIVIGQLAKVGPFSGRQGAETSLAVLGPRDPGGSVERSVCRGAMTGWLAAACVEVIDGTFEELAEREQSGELLLVLVEQ
jgi:hypothetical protein